MGKREIAALGWAFVAFDPQGKVVAVAYGVPPSWVDTIQGAELWAVQMVLASMPLPQRIFTDCKTVQVGVRSSAQWASSAKRRYARIWTVVHAGLDGGDEAHRVVWMPAHTSRDRIGEAKCGDGSVVDEHMWSANQLADLLAKRGAAQVAHSAAFIGGIASKAKLVTELAIYIGRLTHEANQHRGQDGVVYADAQRLEACVARRSALKKQVRKDKDCVASAGAQKSAERGGCSGQRCGGATSTHGGAKGERMQRVGKRCTSSAAGKLQEALAERRFQSAFRASHEARVAVAKPRALAAADRMAQLRDRVKAKQVAVAKCGGAGAVVAGATAHREA